LIGGHGFPPLLKENPHFAGVAENHDLIADLDYVKVAFLSSVQEVLEPAAVFLDVGYVASDRPALKNDPGLEDPLYPSVGSHLLFVSYAFGLDVGSLGGGGGV
jgi:hypothetical protein